MNVIEKMSKSKKIHFIISFKLNFTEDSQKEYKLILKMIHFLIKSLV